MDVPVSVSSYSCHFLFYFERMNYGADDESIFFTATHHISGSSLWNSRRPGDKIKVNNISFLPACRTSCQFCHTIAYTEAEDSGPVAVHTMRAY